MKYYNTLRNAKVTTLIFLMFMLCATFSYAQGLSGSGQQITVNPSQNGGNNNGNTLLCQYNPGYCPFEISLEIVYHGGNIIQVISPEGVQFSPERIEVGYLLELSQLTSPVRDLTKYNDLILSPYRPMNINIRKLNLKTGAYGLVLINNSTQVVTHKFLYIE